MRIFLPSSELVHHEVRRTVCARCRDRRPGCERRCPVFLQLPRLVREAELLDPMIADRREVLLRHVRELCRASHADGRSPLRRHARRLVDAVVDLVDR
jgi:hypothetical protein